MAKITSVHLYYRNGRTNRRTRVVIKPKSQNIRVIKLQIGRQLERIKPTVLANDDKKKRYYYVVFEVERSDGTLGYRTVIGKTGMD